MTTTSGLYYKIPGRVGDSPIMGAGLYLNNEFGSAGSTGRGEANLLNLSSFLMVEELRRGRDPKDAALEACKRVVATNKTSACEIAKSTELRCEILLSGERRSIRRGEPLGRSQDVGRRRRRSSTRRLQALFDEKPPEE